MGRLHGSKASSKERRINLVARHASSSAGQDEVSNAEPESTIIQGLVFPIKDGQPHFKDFELVFERTMGSREKKLVIKIGDQIHWGAHARFFRANFVFGTTKYCVAATYDEHDPTNPFVSHMLPVLHWHGDIVVFHLTREDPSRSWSPGSSADLECEEVKRIIKIFTGNVIQSIAFGYPAPQLIKL